MVSLAEAVGGTATKILSPGMVMAGSREGHGWKLVIAIQGGRESVTLFLLPQPSPTPSTHWG